jgi:F-type H+-transporting ATPase subunit epsilon
MPFHVSILTPEKQIFEGESTSLIVPAELGYLGILANHAPLIANLKPGNITFRSIFGSESKIANKGKGFIEVIGNKATILLDSA